MKRIDVFSIQDDGSEELVCGVCELRGELVPCEGSVQAAKSFLEEPINTPEGRITGEDDPELFMQWAESRASSSRSRVTEPYDDDDSLYDMKSGKYLGDAENPPIPDDVAAA